jgi:hypothetical protein
VIVDAACVDNVCDGTWFSDADLDGDGISEVSILDMRMTCNYDECGPGLHFQDLLNPPHGYSKLQHY